jgi:hypothetical protein
MSPGRTRPAWEVELSDLDGVRRRPTRRIGARLPPPPSGRQTSCCGDPVRADLTATGRTRAADSGRSLTRWSRN